jgi:hypothetical protein
MLEIIKLSRFKTPYSLLYYQKKKKRMNYNFICRFVLV